MKFNKRGGMALTTIIELAIVVVLALAFLNATGLLSDEDTVLELYMARDISRLTDSALSTTYDLKFDYPQSYDKLIFIQDDEIILANNETHLVGGTPVSFTRAKYWSSGIMNVMTSVVLDASLAISILKIDDFILFEDGSTDSTVIESLREKLDINRPSKEDISINIQISGSTGNQNIILNDLKNSIISDLETSGFTDEGSTEINLILEFTEESYSSIYYSSFLKTQTKPLAKQISENINNMIKINGVFEDLEDTNSAKVYIKLSEFEEGRFEEKSDETKGSKSSFSKRIALSFGNFYLEGKE